jgi:DNA-binding response OmpR family regulator
MAATMAEEKPMRLLYVACRRGRAEAMSPSHELRSQLEQHLRRHVPAQIDWTLVNSQKEALRLVRTVSPRLALIEVDATARRLEFGDTLHERMPSVKIVAIGTRKPAIIAHLDGFLCLPLDEPQVTSVLAPLLNGYRSSLLQVGPLRLNVDLRIVVTPKGQYHMTPKTTALLHFLMTHPDQVLSRSELMQHVWDTDFLEDTRTLDVHIRWLRERIEDDPSDPRLLTTVRGHGYRLRLT